MKKQKLLITVFTLLVIVVGVSFAFFLIGATITGTGASSSGSTADLIDVTYLKGNAVTGTLFPGTSVTKEVQVKLTPGSDELNKEATYGIFIDIEENGFKKCTPDLQSITNNCKLNAKELTYTIKEGEKDITPEDNDLTGKQETIRLAKVTHENIEQEVTYTYTIEIKFNDTGADQNHNKNQTFTGSIKVEFADEVDPPSDVTLAKLGLSSQGDAGTITGPSCTGSQGSTCYSGGSDGKTNNMAQHGVFSTEDDFGTSYYFRGFVQNNWVKFGKENGQDLWWRIIRINGNGTIRLIYAGKGSTAPNTTGTETQITTTYSDDSTVQQYNATYKDNRYVGFMYGTSVSDYQSTHANDIKSTIMSELETWYGTTNLGTLEAKIDVDTGFCNDRSLSAAAHGSYQGPGGGTGTTQTAYAPWDRLLEAGTTNAATEQKPTLKCANAKNDLFTGPNAKSGGTEGKDGKKIEGNGKLTKPVGLITSDEVVFAGGFMYQNNDGYWLYTKQNYWTMSPFYFSGSYARVFCVTSYGTLGGSNVHSTYGVRPVINLKADTKFTLKDGSSANRGTTANPYEVS